MATFYLDPVGGNDANDGTTFANRWQTFTNGATAARIAPGDTIRVIGSPDPTSLGQNATFTDGSQTITLTTAVTADITQSNAAWAASTNVTTTTSTDRKLGSTSSSFAIAAGFTTGKAAYQSLGTTVDFSAYQQVSFWIKMTAGSMTADGDITLRLCSDNIGNTTVNTISIPRIRATAQWQPVTVDLGAALGSAIQSIALYVEQDRGAQTFLINNVLACKASSAADSLTLSSLIGKNTGTEPWLPICAITGTTVVIEAYPNAGVNVVTLYSGTTETVTCYKREPLILPSSIQLTTGTDNTFGAIRDSGTAGNLIYFSGGWNRTDMSTQTGDTYISGVNGLGQGLTFASYGVSYVDASKLNYTRFYDAVSMHINCSFTAKDIVNAGNYCVTFAGSKANNTLTIDNAQRSQTYGISLTSGANNNNTITVVNLSGNQRAGLYVQGGVNLYNTFNITNCDRNGRAVSIPSTGSGISLGNTQHSLVNLTNAKGNSVCAVFFGPSSASSNARGNTAYITGTIIDNNVFGTTYGQLQSESPANTFICTGATITKSGGTGGINVQSDSGSSLTVFGGTYSTSSNNFVAASGASLTVVNPTVSAGNLANNSSNAAGFVSIGNLNGDVTDQRTYMSGNSATVYNGIFSDTTTRHTASGISWKMHMDSAFILPSFAPLALPVAKVAVNSGTLVTASVWVYRTSASLTTKFVCAGGQIAGVPTDVVATASAAINTWEQLTITFTPTQQGVVELQVDCYGAAADVYVDDFEVSQA